MRKICNFLGKALLLLILHTLCYASNKAVSLNITGPIGPAAQNYFLAGLKYAQREQAQLIILNLNTPGGILTAIDAIDQAIIRSPIPVVTYISAPGARIARDALFILYASHIAAMAPDTEIGPTPLLATTSYQRPNDPIITKITEESISSSEQHFRNQIIVDIRQLANLRGRNADAAQNTLVQHLTLTPKAAADKKIIDIIAINSQDLLKQINGRTVSLNQAQHKLVTDMLTIDIFKASWQIELLKILGNPNFAYVLLLLGIYCLFLEFYHPGFIVPGVIGVLALGMALYAFHLLPINYVGFALLLLGVAFMMIEILISSLGVLGLAGIVAFTGGSILLLDINAPGYQIDWSLIFTMTLFTIGFFLVMMSFALRKARIKPPVSREQLIGQEGQITAKTKTGWQVVIFNETWEAESTSELKKGLTIRVIEVNDAILKVEPVLRYPERSTISSN